MRDWAYRIFSEPKPISALQQLLGAREKRGKRAANVERDFQIAVAVVEKMNSDMTLDEATQVVASEFAAKGIALEPESIRKIYNRNHIAAKAHIAMIRDR
jgi:hypothetical protein